MANEVESVVNARLEKVEKELSLIDGKIKAATAPYIQQKSELVKQREFYKDIKREAGLLPPKKPMGNPNLRKKSKPE